MCPCGKQAITTIVQIPACAECAAKYQTEGEKYLPIEQRAFFLWFLTKAREAGEPAATNYTYHGR